MRQLHGIVHGQADEPAKQQVVLGLLHELRGERAQSVLPQQPSCSDGEEFKDVYTICSHCVEVVKQLRILLVATGDRLHRSVIKVSVASMGVAQLCGYLL